MRMIKAIPLQAGDDESITINISTECVPIELSECNVFWELKKTMGSDSPELSKTSMGTEYLPIGVVPDIVLDCSENSATININGNETEELYGDYFHYLYVRDKITNKKTSILYGMVSFMESPGATFAKTYYTTPELVANQLRMVNSDGSIMMFTEETDIKRSVVIQFIKEAETRIDRLTRNSWKENYVVDELHDLPFPLNGLSPRDTAVGLPQANICEWDDEKDSLFVFKDDNWIDYTEIPQAQLDDTWWIDYKIGVLHFNNFYPWFYSGANRIKISYRWGNSTVPDDIVEACTKLVAIRIIQSEFNKIMMYNRMSNPIRWEDIIHDWKKDIDSILATRRRKILAVCTR